MQIEWRRMTVDKLNQTQYLENEELLMKKL